MLRNSSFFEDVKGRTVFKLLFIIVLDKSSFPTFPILSFKKVSLRFLLSQTHMNSKNANEF